LGDYRVWGKHTIFDQSVKSVLIVKEPGTKSGAVRDQILSSIDIYPTLMELCGVKTLPALDGKSFAPLLKKGNHKDWDNVAYSYYNKGISVRNDRYRLTKYFRDKEPVVELYDHQTDPHENHNIAAKNPAVVAELSKIWEKGNTGLFDETKKTNE
jgi:iduronate 2-sulfatase